MDIVSVADIPPLGAPLSKIADNIRDGIGTVTSLSSHPSR